MLQGRLELVRALLITIVGLSILLIALVAWFKVRRDRAEARSLAFRTRLREAWQSADPTRIEAIARQIAGASVKEQSDVVAVCSMAEQVGWWSTETRHRVVEAGIAGGLRDAIRRQLGSRSAARRGLAVVLGGHPVAELDPVDLVRFTTDANPTVRMAAAASLERIATPAAAEALVDALVARLLPGPRLVERLGHPWAVDTVLARLAGDAQLPAAVRCDLLRALTLAADARALPVALAVAEAGTPEERIQAARVIAATFAEAPAELRATAAERSLHLAEDEHPNVRGQAVPVLTQVADPRSVDMLVRLAGDPDWFVRRSAARALAALGTEGLDRLGQIARSDDRFAAERAREELAMAAAAAAHRDQEAAS